MKVLRMKQGSIDWFIARLGFATGSHAADIMDFLKQTKAEESAGIKRESAKRANYKAQIVAELLTGKPAFDGYLSPEMEWGNEQEVYARAAYEIESTCDVDLVGFVIHDTIPRMGGSPDALVGDEGLLEIKCPKTSTHYRWLLGGEVPEDHIPQMDFYMACTGRQWCDFVSYDPRIHEALRMFVKRLPRDEERISALEAAVIQFNAEVNQTIERLQAIAGESIEPPRSENKSDNGLEECGITDDEIRAVDPSWTGTAI